MSGTGQTILLDRLIDTTVQKTKIPPPPLDGKLQKEGYGC